MDSIELKGLQSFFEVSIAVNLGFGFFQQLREASKAKLDETAAEFLGKYPQTPEPTSAETQAGRKLRLRIERATAKIADIKSDALAVAERFYSTGRWAAAVGSTVLFGLLFRSGICQAATLEWCQLLGIFVVCVLPIPGLHVSLAIYFRGRVLPNLKRTIESEEGGITAYRDAYDDMIAELGVLLEQNGQDEDTPK